MYDNNWKDDLEDVLRTQYIPETFKNIKLLKDVTANVFKRIVNQICTVYKEPAKRELMNTSGNIVESEIWDKWKKDTMIDVVMQEAHRLSKADTVCYLHIRTSTKKDKIYLHVYTPDIVHVETDPEDKVTPISISYLFTYGEKQYWVYYSKDNRYYLDASGSMLEKDPRTKEVYEKENIYGIIPIVPFHAKIPVVKYYNEHWIESAYESTLNIGVVKTQSNYLIKYTSHKQIVLTGPVSEAVKKNIIDPVYPLVLDQDGSATTLDLTTGSLEANTKYIKELTVSIAGEFGISAESFAITGNVQSGFALKIKNTALEEIRIADIPISGMVEANIFTTFRIINNIDFPEQKIPEELVLRFNPGEIKFPEPWPEEQKRWEFRFKNGTANQIDFMISEDPQLSREDAEKKLVAIREETLRIKPTVSLVDQILGNQNQTEGEI